jgi:uncharacterized membrane protein
MNCSASYLQQVSLRPALQKMQRFVHAHTLRLLHFKIPMVCALQVSAMISLGLHSLRRRGSWVNVFCFYVRPIFGATILPNYKRF